MPHFLFSRLIGNQLLGHPSLFPRFTISCAMMMMMCVFGLIDFTDGHPILWPRSSHNTPEGPPPLSLH
jgi:hypothetical protein